jgi:apolipoprotein N-acyltransferase
MSFIFSRSGLLILLSAILLAVAVMQALFLLSWLCLVPFFIAMSAYRGKKAFRAGALFGFGFCAVLLYWMPSLIGDFTGVTYLGILVYGAAILIATLCYAVTGWTIVWFVHRGKPVWMCALWVASVWTVAEWLLSAALPGMPWFGLFRISNTMLYNLYAIQPATLGGTYLLGFFAVLVNYFIAAYFVKKEWKMMIVPLGIVLLYMTAGYGLFFLFERQHARTKSRPLSLAILCDNTPPDVKWNEANGSFLVKRLLDLNAKAIALKPDVALWSESVVPWTYRADDDFIKEVLHQTASSRITHIMGLTTDYSATEIYNSAYCLLPDGKVSGRYDKHYPVSLAEKPMAFMSLPFSGNGAQRFFEKEGESSMPVPTPYGNAGVLICNDGTVPGATVQQARNGAVFLVSLSNDAWFSHVPYLVRQHFLNTRLRAVEVRKDMAINCNMGVSGLVRASGALQLAAAQEDSFVEKVSIDYNKCLTTYASLPLLMIYVNAAIIIIFISLNVYSIQKPSPQ